MKKGDTKKNILKTKFVTESFAEKIETHKKFTMYKKSI